MANRIDSLLMGLGSVDAVSAAWRHSLDGLSEEQLAVDSFRTLLRSLRDNSMTAQAAAATIAALMNESLETTSQLYSADAQGKLRADYISGKADQQRILSLMAGE